MLYTILIKGKEVKSMGEIETVYTWRCPNCGRIFQDSDREKLEVYRNIHEPACKKDPHKWEHKGPPPRTYFDVGG